MAAQWSRNVCTSATNQIARSRSDAPDDSRILGVACDMRRRGTRYTRPAEGRPEEERRVSASRWSFRRWATDGMGMHGPPGTRLFSQSQRHSLLLRNRALAWPIHRELSSKCDVDNLGGNHYEQDLCTDSRNLAWRMGMA